MCASAARRGLVVQDAQQARIDQLERSAAASVSVSSFSALTSRMEAAIEHMNSQFGALDRRLGQIDDELASTSEILATLPALRTAVDTKLDTDTWMRRTEEARAHAAEQLALVKNDKAAKAVVASLETSQHRLVEEVLALQKLLACKIDRVEVPLLDVASEKLQFLLDFQAAADARLDKNDSDVAGLQRAVASKESRESAAATAAHLREELAKKVDGQWVREQVLAPLHEAEDAITRLSASEEALDKLLTDYQSHLERFARVERGVGEVRAETARLAAEGKELQQQVARKVEQANIDTLLFSNADEVEQLVLRYEGKAVHEAKVQAAYLSDVRQQLDDMQRYQSAVDAKLQVALKFVDWFTDAKLKHL